MNPETMHNSLLDQTNTIEAEIERAENRSGELEARENELLTSGAFDDAKVVQELGQVRAQRDLLPKHIERLTAKRESLQAELAPHAEALHQQFRRALQARLETDRSLIRAALEPFCEAGRLPAAVDAVGPFLKRHTELESAEYAVTAILTLQAADSIRLARAALQGLAALEKL